MPTARTPASSHASQPKPAASWFGRRQETGVPVQRYPECALEGSTMPAISATSTPTPKRPPKPAFTPPPLSATGPNGGPAAASTCWYRTSTAPMSAISRRANTTSALLAGRPRRLHHLARFPGTGLRNERRSQPRRQHQLRHLHSPARRRRSPQNYHRPRCRRQPPLLARWKTSGVPLPTPRRI